VFNRLKANPPDYGTFVERYGKYLRYNEAGDRLPNAAELHEAAKRSKGTAAGIDGWLPAEVALLPLVAWEKRAMHLRLVAENGKWPEAPKGIWKAGRGSSKILGGDPPGRECFLHSFAACCMRALSSFISTALFIERQKPLQLYVVIQ